MVCRRSKRHPLVLDLRPTYEIRPPIEASFSPRSALMVAEDENVRSGEQDLRSLQGRRTGAERRGPGVPEETVAWLGGSQRAPPPSALRFPRLCPGARLRQ